MSIVNRIGLAGSVTGRISLFVLLALVVMPYLLVCGCTEKGLPGDTAALTILVDDPARMDLVRDVASRYQNATGTPVVVEPVPSGWEPGTDTPLYGDLLIADAGRVPVFAKNGHIRLLNPLLNTSNAVNWTLFERPTLSLTGEYPDRSGDMYALAFYQDALGLIFRADLFIDPNESAAFCSTYGYPLGVPGTYDELADLATFFTRNGSNLSGIGFAGPDGEDPISCPWMSILASYGSGISDRTSGKVSGAWNSSRTASALTMLRNLSRSTPAGAQSWSDTEVRDAFSSGSIAMAITWFSLFPDILSDADKNNLSAGIMPLPGEITNEGSYRGISVQIDGIGVLSNGSEKKAVGFLEWFYSPQEQLHYASSGYQPALIPVLDSYTYLSMNQYNRAFPESMRMGVSGVTGNNSEIVRGICEETIRNYVYTDTPGTIQDMLNASVVRLEPLIKS